MWIGTFFGSYWTSLLLITQWHSFCLLLGAPVYWKKWVDDTGPGARVSPLFPRWNVEKQPPGQQHNQLTSSEMSKNMVKIKSDRTWTSYSWLWTNEYQTWVCDRAFPRFTKLLIERTDSNIIFLNIERTWMCSSIGNQTWISNFWLRTMKHRAFNIVQPIPKDSWE